MYYETNCTQVTIKEWENLMKNKKRTSYKTLCRKIKKELPDIYNKLELEFPNPWEDDTYETPTHYILTQSAIEHFIHK